MFTTQLNRYKYNISSCLFLLVFAGSLTACQSKYSANQLTGPVIPKQNGIFETYGVGKSKNDALMAAMHNTTITCNKNSANPIVINYDVKYKGLLNEQTDEMINKVGKIITTMSGTYVPSTQSEKDYEIKMNFKCNK